MSCADGPAARAGPARLGVPHRDVELDAAGDDTDGASSTPTSGWRPTPAPGWSQTHRQLTPSGLLSVQPFHVTRRAYEQLSAVPQPRRRDGERRSLLVGRAATDPRRLRPVPGHHGPDDLRGRRRLRGGRASEVIEDIALARRYGPTSRGRALSRGPGHRAVPDVRARAASLVEGWTKNSPAGPAAPPLLPTLGAVVWVAGALRGRRVGAGRPGRPSTVVGCGAPYAVQTLVDAPPPRPLPRLDRRRVSRCRSPASSDCSLSSVVARRPAPARCRGGADAFPVGALTVPVWAASARGWRRSLNVVAGRCRARPGRLPRPPAAGWPPRARTVRCCGSVRRSATDGSTAGVLRHPPLEGPPAGGGRAVRGRCQRSGASPRRTVPGLEAFAVETRRGRAEPLVGDGRSDRSRCCGTRRSVPS